MNSSSSSPANAFTDPLYISHIIMYALILVVALPINIYVLWLIKTGGGSRVASEYFILNLSVCEISIGFAIMLNIISTVLYSNKSQSPLDFLTACLGSLHVYARPFFQCCICVERYIAVLHPVIYLKCKPLRFRVAFSAVAWLNVLGIGVLCASIPVRSVLLYVALPQYLLFFSVMLFCSVVVLKALKKPGPGEKLSDKESQVNCMKRKAFRVILIIQVFMAITYGPAVAFIFLYDVLSESQRWDGISVFAYLTVIAGFLHPFLFLHRAGKLPFIQGLGF